MNDTTPFSTNDLDRLPGARSDVRRADAVLDSDSTRFILVNEGRVLLSDRPSAVFATRAEVRQIIDRPHDPIILGALNGTTYCALDTTGLPPEKLSGMTARGEFLHLRSRYPLLNEEEVALLGYAVAVTHWQGRTRFCGACGTATEPAMGGNMRRCTDPYCGQTYFPRVDPAVIVLVTRGNACLLSRNKGWVKGRLGCLSGYLEPGESAEGAVIREVAEESGLTVFNVRYFGSQPWPFPASFMLAYQAEAAPGELVIAEDELDDARWVTRESLIQSLRAGEFTLPPRRTVAFRLIENWFDTPGGPRLADVADEGVPL